MLPRDAHAKLEAIQAKDEITTADIAVLERLFGLSFQESERKSIAANLMGLRKGYEAIRKLPIDNAVAPPLPFVVYGKQPAAGKSVKVSTKSLRPALATDEDVAFASIVDLGDLIRRKKISSVELTHLYLKRLKAHGTDLLNVINLTEETALRQAKAADDDLARGYNRGALHGIPYGIKDLFAAKGYPTTWGAEPYEKQMLDYDATVVRKLEAAGAVLCAKLSCGALAMDDHWFKGKTKNPWNTAQGSSGSSAGSASATAAGLVGFTIGTETLGSIMSPSHRCRVYGLRPTFGRVSRAGAMALSWTMDKVGPIARGAQDCALILPAIMGHDAGDVASVDRPFTFRPDLDLSKLKIGYIENDAALDEDDSGSGASSHLKLLKSLGADPRPIKITPPGDGIDMVLSVEAAAVFDELTRTGAVNSISASLWADIFRTHRFVPGVEFLQAMRARFLLMQQFEKELGDFDAIIASDRGSFLLFITNLTGHPQMYVPMGTNAKGVPRGLSIVGRLYDEGTILGMATRIQSATDYWKLRPQLS